MDDLITAVDVLDQSTVRFTLSRLEPSFITGILPSVYIDSKALIERQFQVLRETLAKVGSSKLSQEADSFWDPVEANDFAGCTALVNDAEGFAASAGIELPDKRIFRAGPDGKLTPAGESRPPTSVDCAWLNAIHDMLYAGAGALDTSGIEAQAVAYRILPMQWHPLGAGAWILDESLSVPGEHLVLTASPTADPAPATPRIDFLTYTTREDAVNGLRDDEIDWLALPWETGAETVRAVEAIPGIKVGQSANAASWTDIDFNVREGQLFSDRNLRKALSLCINREAAVRAATDGTGAPAAGVFGPEFWAANPTLSVPQRDEEAARHLIETSGWQLHGSTYELDGRPLAADLWVREEYPVRVKLAELVASEAADCGFHLTVKVGDYDSLFGEHPLTQWPNHPPDSDRPFDAYLLGWVGIRIPDPAGALENYLTVNIDTKQNPTGANSTGYSNVVVDDLLAQADATLDVPLRASLYREVIAILADDLPFLPLFYPLNRIAVRDGLTSLDGPLQLDRPVWDWQLESIMLRTDGR
jgi:ABC-type transport system substrate-binding protein